MIRSGTPTAAGGTACGQIFSCDADGARRSSASAPVRVWQDRQS